MVLSSSRCPISLWRLCITFSLRSSGSTSCFTSCSCGSVILLYHNPSSWLNLSHCFDRLRVLAIKSFFSFEVGFFFNRQNCRDELIVGSVCCSWINSGIEYDGNDIVAEPGRLLPLLVALWFSTRDCWGPVVLSHWSVVTVVRWVGRALVFVDCDKISTTSAVNSGVTESEWGRRDNAYQHWYSTFQSDKWWWTWNMQVQ